jgi:hypothetical protein
VFALRDTVFQLLERKASFVDGAQQPNEEDDFGLIRAFDGAILRDVKNVIAPNCAMPLALRPSKRHQIAGRGKHPSGAEIAGVVGNGGVAVIPTSSG